MLLYLIRHGEPDYVTDTLTEEGWKQARLVSVRLIESGLDEIHSSPMGRARQTAQPTAEKLGLPVIVEPWAYELGAECRTTYPDGKPKLPSTLPPEYLHQPAFRKFDSLEGIRQIPGLNDSQLADRFEMISTGTDAMLEKLGFRRNEDGTYDVIAPSDRHIALFCHAGMMRVILAHLLNLPFQLLEASTMCHYTGITILRFKDGSDRTSPVLFSYADTGHLYGQNSGPLIHYSSKKPY